MGGSMAKVTIYREVATPAGEMPLVEAMARMKKVQAALSVEAERIRLGAAAQLAAHHHSGDAQILPVERGDVDRFVVLSDRRGQWAAWAIENGAKGGRGGIHALAVGAVARLGVAHGGIW